MVSAKAIRVALYTKLNTASVTNQLAAGSASLFHEVAPGGAQYPMVIFGRQSSVAVKNFGGNAFDNQMWRVKAVVQGQSSSVAEDIAKAVSDLLDFGTLTITGGTLLHLSRESDFDYVETSNDSQFRHHGAVYRVVVA